MNEKMRNYLQVNKRTGEIKTANDPRYLRYYLSDVYGTHSHSKAQAIKWCIDFMRENVGASNVISYGITSANIFKFIFAFVFTDQNKKYVCKITAKHVRVYLLE